MYNKHQISNPKLQINSKAQCSKLETSRVLVIWILVLGFVWYLTFVIWNLRLCFSQVSPSMQAVRVLVPAVANIRAIIHVGDNNVFNAAVDLRLSLFHSRPGATNN